jgi:AAA domain
MESGTPPLLLATKNAPGELLGRYSYSGPVRRQYNPEKGLPAIRYVHDPSGELFLAKSWLSGPFDSDLTDFWHYELRELRRLSEYRGAEDYLARTVDAGVDRSGFHLITELGDRRLICDRLPPREGPLSVEDRALLWENLVRTARALRLLHSQGLTHRNFDVYSMLTSGVRYRPDFLLSGFEWSVRALRWNSQGPQLTGESTHSAILYDWRDFARVVLDLLHLTENQLHQLTKAPNSGPGDLTPAELSLLHDLLKLPRLDSDVIVSRMDAVSAAVSLQATGRSLEAVLAIRLGEDNNITRAIQRASGGQISIYDRESQRAFIESDLAEAIVIGGRARHRRFIFALRGSSLEYQLTKEFFGRTSGWVQARCQSAVPAAASSLRIVRQSRLDPFEIVVRPDDDDDVRAAAPNESGAWDALREQVEPQRVSDSHIQLTANALLLVSILQYLTAAANEFPVEVLPAQELLTKNGLYQHHLVVRPREDAAREQLNMLLGYTRPQGTRLHEALTGSGDLLGDSWRFIEDANEADRDGDRTEWSYDQKRDKSDVFSPYVFAGDAPAPRTRKGYLVPSQFSGAEKQLNRQLNALQRVCDDALLLDLLTSPSDVIRETGDEVRIDWADVLDDDKIAALQSILGTYPFFMVQGPPGVGKTRLITALVKELCDDSQWRRILLSAQSHTAVDHLLEELEAKDCTNSFEEPIIVRCRSKDRKKPGRFDVTLQVKKFVEAIQASDLLKEAPPMLRQKIKLLSQATSARAPEAGCKAPEPERHAFEALLLRSANLVFGTSNSGAIERLATERAQFDWVVVEEAAKATGCELLNPLLLAERRLLIGDHRQLPPFDSQRLQQLLESPTELSKLLHLVQGLQLRSLWHTDIGSLLREYGAATPSSEDVSEIEKLCKHALRMLSLFQGLFEEAETSTSQRPWPYARTLWSQHRMHPRIADLVSDGFYPRKLRSHPDCVERFRRPSPVVFAGCDAQVPVIWINMPWAIAQRPRGANRTKEPAEYSTGEKRPTYHNPDEVRAVVWAICSLRVAAPSQGEGTKPPTLAVLSPYRRQVDALHRALEHGSPELRRRLNAFEPVGGAYVHTVDSFQGNQADVVIVSMVRNNHRAGILGSLGFLADDRRMNVLFSRAKWRLVIVGCRRFLREVVERNRKTKTGPSIEFLSRLLRSLDQAHSRRHACTVPFGYTRRQRGRRRR